MDFFLYKKHIPVLKMKKQALIICPVFFCHGTPNSCGVLNAYLGYKYFVLELDRG